jgi:hypothetical protein
MGFFHMCHYCSGYSKVWYHCFDHCFQYFFWTANINKNDKRGHFNNEDDVDYLFSIGAGSAAPLGVVWIKPSLRGHLSYKATSSLSQRWPFNSELTVYGFSRRHLKERQNLLRWKINSQRHLHNRGDILIDHMVKFYCILVSKLSSNYIRNIS